MTNRGIIVALIPDEQYTSRRPAINQPHLTVLHLGKVTDEDFSLSTLKEYRDMLVKVWGHQIRAEVTAESAFWAGPDDGWAMVDLVNAPFLPEFYSVAQESAQLFGIDASKEFGLLPHITKRYVKGQSHVEIVHRPLSIPFAFRNIGLWVGEEKYESSLT